MTRERYSRGCLLTVRKSSAVRRVMALTELDWTHKPGAWWALNAALGFVGYGVWAYTAVRTYQYVLMLCSHHANSTSRFWANEELTTWPF